MRIALVLIAIVLNTVALGGIITVARQYDLAAAGALITAWATIVGVLITQLVAVWTAAQQREHASRSEDQRAQDEALLEYFDHMSQLLLDKDRPLLNSKTDNEASILAKARTLTVLTRLDGRRKRSVVDFLFESSLISKNSKGLGDWPLKEADLRKAHLSEAHLVETNLSYARLSEADLERADLRGANLRGAKLSKAILSGAQLGPPDPEEGEPNPTPADLSDADLSDARGVTNEQLDEQAADLKGTTMPDGQKYEDWLKSKDQGENKKSDGSS